MLETLPVPPVDPILALGTAARADPRADKIDLGIGVYRDEEGRTPIMAAVTEAERRLLTARTTKTYVGARGDVAFAGEIGKLVFGKRASERVAAMQATGGTGALRILAGIIARTGGAGTVWLPETTWLNHHTIFNDAGLRTATYPYYDHATSQVRSEAMLAAFEALPCGDVVLLHGCCHNPSGADLSMAEWEEIAGIMARRGILPLVDLAYQGFGKGFDEDGAGVRLLAEHLPEMLVASSCSKNFGLYCERTGCALILAQTARGASLAAEHMALIARPIYSMPPDHGSAIVRTILEDPALTVSWRDELEATRLDIATKRRQLSAGFRAATGGEDFDYIDRGTGMFTMLKLSTSQIESIRQKHGIYIVGDGRINIAGLRSIRMADFVLAVLATQSSYR
ncbi:amino acid aminotransferase [Bosea beijingensis]